MVCKAAFYNFLSTFSVSILQEQASWVCQCDEGLVHKLEEDFKQTLAEQVNDVVLRISGILISILKLPS